MTVSPGGRIRAGPRAAWRGTLAAMPQVQLPVFPAGATLINDALACEFRDGQAVYFNGHLPVGTHAEDDLASIRFFTTQLIVNGMVRRMVAIVKKATRKLPATFVSPGQLDLEIPTTLSTSKRSKAKGGSI